MCYLMVYVIFDFQAETALKDSAAIGRALTKLSENGFHTTDEGFESAAAVWNAALRRGQRSVWAALENEAHFALSVSVVTNNWRRLYISADRGMAEKPQHSRTLIEVAEMLYNALHPDYGYGLVSLDMQMLNPPGDGDYGISTVYDYNFFSPRLVAKLGRNRLNEIAVSRAAALDDGGVLLELSPTPLSNKQVFAANYQSAAALLRTEKIQQGT